MKNRPLTAEEQAQFDEVMRLYHEWQAMPPKEQKRRLRNAANRAESRKSDAFGPASTEKNEMRETK